MVAGNGGEGGGGVEGGTRVERKGRRAAMVGTQRGGGQIVGIRDSMGD